MPLTHIILSPLLKHNKNLPHPTKFNTVHAPKPTDYANKHDSRLLFLTIYNRIKEENSAHMRRAL